MQPARRLLRLSGMPGMRWGFAGLLAVAALVAGCGSARGSGTPGTVARTGSASATASASAAPPAGSRAEALAYARQLLAEVVLPSGTQPARLATVPVLAQNPFLLGPEGSSAGTGRVYQAPQPMNKVVSFLEAHAPRGMSSSDSAAKETGPHGTTGEEVDWTASRLPSGLQSASFRIMVTPRSSGSAVIGVYDNVYWFPARSATEHIDARRYQRVTVSATAAGRTRPTKTQTFTSAAIIGRLAGYLNSLPASTGEPTSCPAVLLTTTLTFTGPGVPDVVASADGCLSDGVTAGGKVQPALQDESNKLSAMAEQLLHLSPPRS